jgi:hypothetical protein
VGLSWRIGYGDFGAVAKPTADSSLVSPRLGAASPAFGMTRVFEGLALIDADDELALAIGSYVDLIEFLDHYVGLA